MELKPDQKVCPKCYLVNEDFAKVCMKCGYHFSQKSMKENSDNNQTSDHENNPEPSIKKCDNPKAPKKTCPSCGAKVYINRAVCPECNHQFEFKGKKSSSKSNTQLSNKKHENPSKTDEFARSPGIPIKSYLLYLIPMAVWFAICFFLHPWLYSKIDLGILIADFILFFVSLGLGVLFGHIPSFSYKYRASKYAFILSFLSIIGILVFDYFQLKKVWSAGDFENSLIHTCMLIVITTEIITQAIAYIAAIKDYYCDRCNMANLVFLESTEDGESHVEYKFVTHEAETHTATVTEDTKYRGSIGSATPEHFEANESTTYTIKYKTPEWQENLGLHKYTKYTKIYRCKRCGHIKKEHGTREEKV